MKLPQHLRCNRGLEEVLDSLRLVGGLALYSSGTGIVGGYLVPLGL